MMLGAILSITFLVYFLHNALIEILFFLMGALGVGFPLDKWMGGHFKTTTNLFTIKSNP